MAVLNIRLTDSETGAPVRYTPVWLDSIQTSTDQNGSVRFDVPAGTHTLKVRSPLYEPYTAPATVPGTVEVKLRRILL
jgi:hypothetical protein